MAKAKKKAATGLTAAECARRTGLTVRALRVYEKYGLVKPARSGKGWRLYGPDELARLNAVVALKDFGLSLAQIRKTFNASQPPLSEVLDLQLKAWLSRKVAADRAIALIGAAMARLRANAPLSVDELCQLLRSTEVTDLQAITRELINQNITPEQEREWLTYWAQRKPEEVLAGRETRAAYRAISEEYLKLMKRGAAPDSEETQAIVERSKALWVTSGMRERQLEQLAWNPEVTRAWFRLGGKLQARSVVPDDAGEAERLREYIVAARRCSRSAAAFTPIVIEAQRLCAEGVPQKSAEARSLGARFVALCKEFQYGDPVVHARWIAAFGEIGEQDRAAWQYLAELVNADR